MVYPLKVELNADRSCNNWRCCFDRQNIDEPIPNKDLSPHNSETETVETVTKVTHVFHRSHLHHKELPLKD